MKSAPFVGGFLLFWLVSVGGAFGLVFFLSGGWGGSI
jgi:hypothetical protein